MKKMSETGRKLLMALMFTIIPMLTFADPGEPCDDSDPLDNMCPLDSWVYMTILVVIAVVFVGIYLRKQAIKELAKEQQLAASAN
jgi:hypothetical protein